jgi:hypothetical protein
LDLLGCGATQQQVVIVSPFDNCHGRSPLIAYRIVHWFCAYS